MANEIGYWNGGAGINAETIFTGGQCMAPVGGTAIYTASAGQSINKVRVHRSGGSGSATATIALMPASGGVVTVGSSPVASASITLAAASTTELSVNWSLAGGSSYALALGDVSTNVNISGDALANGTDNNDVGTGFAGTWVHSGFKPNILEIAGDVISGTVVEGKTLTQNTMLSMNGFGAFR